VLSEIVHKVFVFLQVKLVVETDIVVKVFLLEVSVR